MKNTERRRLRHARKIGQRLLDQRNRGYPRPATNGFENYDAGDGAEQRVQLARCATGKQWRSLFGGIDGLTAFSRSSKLRVIDATAGRVLTEGVTEHETQRSASCSR